MAPEIEFVTHFLTLHEVDFVTHCLTLSEVDFVTLSDPP